MTYPGNQGGGQNWGQPGQGWGQQGGQSQGWGQQQGGQQGGQQGWGPQQGGGQTWGQQPPTGGQQYPPTSQYPTPGYSTPGYGTPVPPQPEPPQKKGPNKVAIISVVAILLIVAGVVAVVFLNKKDSPAADGGDKKDGKQIELESGKAKPSTTGSVPTTTGGSTGSANPGQPRNPGWTVIVNDKLKLAYEVPATWKQQSEGLETKTLPGKPLLGVASLTDYKCDGKDFGRGGVGSTSVDPSDVNKVATDLAKGWGAEFYSGSTGVQASEPKPVTWKSTSGKEYKGAQVDAIVTTPANPCLATKGKVSVVVVDAGSAYAVFMVNGDLEGGPASPPPPSDDELNKILASARPAV